MLNTLSSMIVIDTLEEFEDHKANLKEARKSYVSNSLRFLEAAKSASTGRVEDARVDNFSFYLQYLKNSIVEVAKIIDKANLTHRSIECRRDVVAIGESEVEIITERGIRNYANLTGNIVLTFYTDLGKIDVRLSSDEQDRNKIIVEVSNKKEILEKFKNCKEELGKGCVFCGYCVYDTIEQEYFKRSEGFKIISPPKSSLQNISLFSPMQESTGKAL
ncbi:MAG: hypothetical protein ACR5KV_01100 [Wolbachia sp.]